jgi:hypothetical protein
MLELIRQIDNAWINKEKLFGIYPEETKGYFNFRNNIILKYNRQFKKEGN